MVDVWRIVCGAFLLLAIYLLSVQAVHAAVPKVTQDPVTVYSTRSRFNTSMNATGWHSSRSAACSIAMSGGEQVWSGSVVGEVCYGGPSWDPQAVAWGFITEVQPGGSMCPNSSTENAGGTCDCNSGFTQSTDNKSCEVNNTCSGKKGQSAGRWDFPHTPGDPLQGKGKYICDSGCTISVTYDFASGSNPASMVKSGSGGYTGGACSGSLTSDGSLDNTPAEGKGLSSAGSGSGSGSGSSGSGDAPKAVQSPCAKGEFTGSVNGAPVCIKPSNTTPVVTEKVNKTETTIPNPTNPSGPPVNVVKTDVTRTECLGDVCTSTVTTSYKTPVTTSIVTNPDGSTSQVQTGGESVGGGGTSNSEGGREDFCKENPKSAICVESSWGGACGGGFTCQGDAIQCAIAKEQHVRNCKLFDDTSSAEAQKYTEAVAKVGINNNPDNREAVVISSNSFDTSNAFGSGSGCIADKDIVVAGQALSIPLSKVCPYLEYIGSINLLLSFLLAGRIIVRG